MSIFIIVWVVWFLSEVLLNILLRSGSGDKKGKDNGTIHAIWITIGMANTIGILSAIFIPIPVYQSILIPYTGLGIIIFGMIIRFYAIASLGRFFTVDVTIRSNHQLKTTGIYKIIRHPSYLGSIISFIGLWLSLNNIISLIIIPVLITYTMIRRINTEEKVLAEQFGQEYTEYREKIIPTFSRYLLIRIFSLMF